MATPGKTTGPGYKEGYVDKTGDIVIKAQFDQVHEFSEGLACVGVGPHLTWKYGFIDRTGKMLIKPQFDYPAMFTDGIALVRMGGRALDFGYIDKTGKFIWKSCAKTGKEFEENE